jgi:putative hydrolase of the HAD superfamily
LIKDLEEASWSDLVYIGDDPSKDFVNLKPLGVTTVRVIKGRHSSIKLSKTYEADFQISGINKLSEVLGFNNG